MKLITVVLAGLLLAGCATAHRMNLVSLGMTKQDVLTTLGRPTSTSAQQGAEYLTYRLSETDDDAIRGRTTPYFIRIVEGKVESYGRLGDFDSTKDPAVDLTIKQR